jgi:hypothetical protein
MHNRECAKVRAASAALNVQWSLHDALADVEGTQKCKSIYEKHWRKHENNFRCNAYPQMVGENSREGKMGITKCRPTTSEASEMRIEHNLF